MPFKRSRRMPGVTRTPRHSLIGAMTYRHATSNNDVPAFGHLIIIKLGKSNDQKAISAATNKRN